MRFMKIVFSLMILFCGYAFAAEEKAAAATEDHSAIIVMQAKPQFSIHLPSNPSTGYSWFLHQYDIHTLTPIGHYFQKQAANQVGATGVEVWTFRVRKSAFKVPKQTTIDFLYARPWESVPPAKEKLFKVSIMK